MSMRKCLNPPLLAVAVKTRVSTLFKSIWVQVSGPGVIVMLLVPWNVPPVPPRYPVTVNAAAPYVDELFPLVNGLKYAPLKLNSVVEETTVEVGAP